MKSRIARHQPVDLGASVNRLFWPSDGRGWLGRTARSVGGATDEAAGAAGLGARCSGHGGRGAGLAAGDEEGEGGPGGRGARPGASDEEVERGVRQWLRLREGRKGRDKGGECGSHWNLFKIYNLF